MHLIFFFRLQSQEKLILNKILKDKNTPQEVLLDSYHLIVTL